MLKLEGIHHYALSVKNLEATATWYTEMLGFTAERQFSFPEVNTEVIHLISPAGIRLELLHTPDAASSPDEGKDAFTAIATRGSKHIGLRVADISEAVAYLKSKGVTVLHEMTVVEKAGVTNAWILDNEGNQIELDEPLAP